LLLRRRALRRTCPRLLLSRPASAEVSRNPTSPANAPTAPRRVVPELSARQIAANRVSSNAVSSGSEFGNRPTLPDRAGDCRDARERTVHSIEIFRCSEYRNAPYYVKCWFVISHEVREI